MHDIKGQVVKYGDIVEAIVCFLGYTENHVGVLLQDIKGNGRFLRLQITQTDFFFVRAYNIVRSLNSEEEMIWRLEN